MRVNLAGLVFVADGAEATYTIEGDGLKGWFDGVEMRREFIPRPSANGDFDVPGYLASRIITLEGLIQTSTPTEFEGAMLALENLLADGSSALLAVEQATGTFGVNVRRHGKPDIIMLVYGVLARYQLQLWAADPRKYGSAGTFGPSSTVSGIHHDGNFPASPVLTIAGSSGGGYTVTGPGSRVITVTEALVSGHPHTIDLATGALMVDGDRVLGGISVYQPWTVPVGSSVTVSVSAGTVAVAVKDTYV